MCLRRIPDTFTPALETFHLREAYKDSGYNKSLFSGLPCHVDFITIAPRKVSHAQKENLEEGSLQEAQGKDQEATVPAQTGKGVQHLPEIALYVSQGVASPSTGLSQERAEAEWKGLGVTDHPHSDNHRPCLGLRLCW